jgi:hypothetical protein
MTFTRSMMLLALVAGCSETFDANAPVIALEGTQPSMTNLPRLNTMPVTSESYTRGADGHEWIVMSQVDKSWRAVSLFDSSKVETLMGDEVLVAGSVLYITKMLDSPDSPVQQLSLTVRSLGEEPGHVFTLPSNGAAILQSFGADQVFFYAVADPSLKGYFLIRRDGSFMRQVPWPKGIDASDPFSSPELMFFPDTGAGKTFYDRGVDGRIVGHHTLDAGDVDIGIRPKTLTWMDDHTLVTCGNDGVRVVPVDGMTAERVLDDNICQTTLLYLNDGYVYYDVDTAVRKTKLDGSAPPRILYEYGQNRVLRIHPADDSIIYSTDPADRYSHGAGDGWLGNWKFMQRGSDLTYTGDRLNLYWLEDSAQSSGAGELTMATLPGPAKTPGVIKPLALNSRGYSFLSDGRIIANANYAFEGTFNRIILIDPKKERAQWMADSAHTWSIFTDAGGKPEAIIDVVTGATSGYDVVRMPVPPPLP